MVFSRPQDVLSADAYAFYQKGLVTLSESGVPFLVGGAYAFERYTQIARHTKDLDIFVRPQDCARSLQVLSTAGYQTDLTFPHWLGKAFYGENFIDVIFSSGNGLCKVDDEWFAYAVEREVLDVPVLLCPAEEMIWSKAFIEERERYDGADIAHVLRACSTHLDWPRLLRRFDGHWRVLLSHLVLFGFVYPAEQSQVPDWVMRELMSRLQQELQGASLVERICQGTLLSREQYLTDITHWGYHDARLSPTGLMTPEDIAHWTAAIGEKS
ncbi:MAG: hypothetical protein ACRERD_25925 [Candidatus Binatia bacterium]